MWRTTRFIQNDPCAHYKEDGSYQEFWNDAADNTGTTGACQDAGTAWRTPSQPKWGELYAGGLVYGAPIEATANSWAWVGTANTAHGYKVMPDNSTVTLFLPASGYRNGANGLLVNQGGYGYYWSICRFDCLIARFSAGDFF